MGELAKNPYMDYRNVVPFVDLSGYVVKQPRAIDEMPIKSLREFFIRKKFSLMVNIRRLQYKISVEGYKNGRR